jgi:GGDEF domain-containing protein
VLLAWSGRLLMALSRATHRTDALERELALLRRAHLMLEQDQQRLAHFLHEFPLLNARLSTAKAQQRRIPHVLANVAMRSLHPGQAVVLLRRRPTENEPERANRFVVAAVMPEGCPGAGRRGDRDRAGGTGLRGRDAAGDEPPGPRPRGARGSRRLRQQGLPGFEPDLLAPMIFEGETIGLIALSGCNRTSEDAKAALRLIAQTGAQAVHNAAAYNHMKTTADLDGLTGIFNKRQMTLTLAEQLHEGEKSLRPLSVFLFDVGQLQELQRPERPRGGRPPSADARPTGAREHPQDGHLRPLRRRGVPARPPNTPLQHAMTVADKIRAAIAAKSCPARSASPLGCISVSGGVAQYPVDALDSAKLLHAADCALYEAKRQGRNRVLRAACEYLSEASRNGWASRADWELRFGAPGKGGMMSLEDPALQRLAARPPYRECLDQLRQILEARGQPGAPADRRKPARPGRARLRLASLRQGAGPRHGPGEGAARQRECGATIVLALSDKGGDAFLVFLSPKRYDAQLHVADLRAAAGRVESFLEPEAGQADVSVPAWSPGGDGRFSLVLFNPWSCRSGSSLGSWTRRGSASASSVCSGGSRTAASSRRS